MNDSVKKGDLIRDDNCFVCGQANHQGLQATFEIDRDRRRSITRLAVPRRFQGWDGLVHGGILATLIDEACIYACRSLGERFVTGEMSIRYRRPVPVERQMVVIAEVLEVRKRLLRVSARIEIEGRTHTSADAKIVPLP